MSWRMVPPSWAGCRTRVRRGTARVRGVWRGEVTLPVLVECRAETPMGKTRVVEIPLRDGGVETIVRDDPGSGNYVRWGTTRVVETPVRDGSGSRNYCKG